MTTLLVNAGCGASDRVPRCGRATIRCTTDLIWGVGASDRQAHRRRRRRCTPFQPDVSTASARHTRLRITLCGTRIAKPARRSDALHALNRPFVHLIATRPHSETRSDAPTRHRPPSTRRHPHLIAPVETIRRQNGDQVHNGGYPALTAVIGSSRAARRPGSTLAASPARMANPAIPANHRHGTPNATSHTPPNAVNVPAQP